MNSQQRAIRKGHISDGWWSTPAGKLHSELAAYAMKERLEKMIVQAARAGVTIVADADAVAIRLIPTIDIASGADIRNLGIAVRVHNACGGGSSAIGSDPATHGGRP